MKNTNFNDDLILGNGEPIIIQKSSNSDKKFIYTILILLVILFIIVLGVVIYFGSKMFNNATNNTTTPLVVNEAKKVMNINATSNQKNNERITNKNENNKEDIAQLESILETSSKVKRKNNDNIQKAVASATENMKLSQKDLQKIAALVAEQLSKQEIKIKNKEKINNQEKSNMSSEEELVKSLQAASTDTLKENKIAFNSMDIDNNRKINNTKKLDTFNKVIIKENNSNENDEFVKLSKEIDDILQTEDVKKVEQKENKKFRNIVETRTKELRFIIVKPGDTLSSLARRAYGKASAYVKIYKANPDLIKNPNKIYIGQKLRVPVDNEYQGSMR